MKFEWSSTIVWRGALYHQNLRMEKSIAAKDQVVKMLQKSLDAVREQFSQLSAADLEKPANFFGEQTTVRRVYLRIFAHANQHMGQAIACARINGIVPPWSRPKNELAVARSVSVAAQREARAEPEETCTIRPCSASQLIPVRRSD